MVNLHRVLFCTGINLNDIMKIDCFAYKYIVFYRFSLVVYIIWYCYDPGPIMAQLEGFFSSDYL